MIPREGLADESSMTMFNNNKWEICFKFFIVANGVIKNISLFIPMLSWNISATLDFKNAKKLQTLLKVQHNLSFHPMNKMCLQLHIKFSLKLYS